MLAELTIRDLAIISELHLEFGPGFNVLTGETGAGKSIILDAVTLVIGGRADTSLIRAGCDKAYVEAVFKLTPAGRQTLLPLLEEDNLEEEVAEETVTLARELRANGRNTCRLNGITIKSGLLKELGEQLIGIHGQGEHLALLHPKSHRPLLDAYANLTSEQQALAEEVRQLRTIQRELTELRRDERTRQQRLDMLKFQVSEIDAAHLTIGEEEELRVERTRLSNVEQLARQSLEAVALLIGSDFTAEAPNALDLISQAEASVSVLAKLDSSQQELYARLQGVVAELSEIGGEVRSYQESLEHDPERLNYLEERLELINRLKRKYGASISEILQTRDQAVRDLDNIEHSDERAAELEQKIDVFLRKIGKLGTALSSKRQKAAETLAQAIEKELSDLKMTARFAVDFQQTPAEPAENGAYVGDKRLLFDHTGIDQLEFLISANPGEPLKPMAKVASGGETARLMLALKTALAQVDSTPTLIFDEIDQGIGGRVGTIVGQKLWGLSSVANHQVIVVTHLPQMAGFGDVHFHVSKQVQNGRTMTNVQRLESEPRLLELGAMLGTQGPAAREGAQALLQEAEMIKSKGMGNRE